MKRLNLMVLMLASAVMLCFTSCLNEAADSNSSEGQLPANVATLAEQVASMKSSVAALETLQVTLSETAELQSAAAQIESCATSVKEHIASIEAGMSGVNAAIAAMKLQKEIANVTGALKVTVAPLVNRETLLSDILSLESSVAAWLGKEFKNYFAVSAEQTRLASMLSIVKSQSISADAISSDVEAGLRVGDATGLNEVVATVAKNSETLSELSASMTALASEVEQGYTSAINSNSSKSALKALNTKATTALANSTPTINELDARIKACEEAIADLNTRLEKVETDINALLGMIQSLTFVSEYSDDKAVAYYRMTSEENQKRGEGKKDRVPAETFNLTFLVRPAAVADALAQTWQESLSVIGYYANAIQTRATANIQAFEIVDAVSTTGKGLLTVTVNNAFDDDFYFKEKGAKLALAVESGKNNCASKFIEIVPRDITGKVYAESLELTPTTLSIQDGDSYQLSAVVKPNNVTDAGVQWNTFGTDYFTVDAHGRLTATKVGDSPVEVTANATDEWGRPLTAQCKVTVTPAIRINGPAYVEVGGKIKFTLESPNVIYPNDAKWNITTDAAYTDAANYVAWTKDEASTDLVIEGISPYYNIDAKEYYKFVVTCTVGQANPVTVSKELRVVYPQPNGVALKNGLPNDADRVTVKIGQKYNLASDILPESARATGFFRCKYESNMEYIVECGIANYEGEVKAVGVGEASMTIKVLTATSYDYYYPKSYNYERYIKMQVEPYWVESIAFSESIYEVAPGTDPFVINPIFTSDVEGYEPTDKKLVWSIEPGGDDVLTIDPETGLITLKEGAIGSATITATTSGANSVPKDEQHKSASITINVAASVLKADVGDYYYSDGTWGKDPNPAGLSVIGVVVYSSNVANEEQQFLGKCDPLPTHGLAIGVRQIDNKPFVNGSTSASRTTPAKWLFRNGYLVYDETGLYGYGNTKGLELLPDDSNALGICVADYISLYQIAAPQISTGWYIPSYKEFQIIAENITTINNAINAVGGVTLSSDLYWTSTIRTVFYQNRLTESYLDQAYYTPFSLSKKTWNNTAASADNGSYPVRVVLAF